MKKRTGILLAMITSLLLTGSQLIAQEIQPSVSYTFDLDTCTYTYSVEYLSESACTLGSLEVDTKLPSDDNSSIPPPCVPDVETGVDEALSPDSTARRTDSECDIVYWPATLGQEVMPGTPLTGKPALVAPPPPPVLDWGVAKNGVEDGLQWVQIGAPGQPVPEPGGIVALGVGFASLVGCWFRRR